MDSSLIVKFRAYSRKFKLMVYPDTEGYAIHIDASGGVHSVWKDSIDDEGVPIMQFTGKADKQHTEIYQSDILKNPLTGFTYEVAWNEKYAQWYAISKDGYNTYTLCKVESDWIVIGNTYENPKLFK